MKKKIYNFLALLIFIKQILLLLLNEKLRNDFADEPTSRYTVIILAECPTSKSRWKKI